MTSRCALPNRAILRLTGEDTRPFLQGLITNDINALSTQPAIFAAMLSPQGKFQHDFFLIRDGDDILLETEFPLADALQKKLKRYKLRSKVTITDESNQWHIYAEWGEDKPCHSRESGNPAFPDPRHPALGIRILSHTPLDATAPYEAYDQHRLQLGIPSGAADASERAVIMELGYDQLHAISFTKGCYVGQEVTARMHYRNILRKCLYIITADNPLPAIGTPITRADNEKPVGEMRSSNGTIGLALLRIEAAQSTLPLYANGLTLTATLPPYMTEKITAIHEAGAAHPPS